MMQLEKKLANKINKTGGAFEGYKENKLAKGIVQYQKFRVGPALDKIGPIVGYKINSLKRLFNAGVRYLETGNAEDMANINKSLKTYIDEWKTKLSPLTPKESEKRFKRGIYYGRKNKSNTEEIEVKPLQQKPKLAEEFKYGLYVDEVLKIFDTSKEREIFEQGLEFARYDKEIKKCHVNIEFE